MKNETKTQTASNDLRFTTTKRVADIEITVKIRLNDQCKNGHQDFSITGDIYKAGLPRTDSNHISGGCIHDEIAKYFPEFKQFINLHLCDWNGIPMYAVENGFYHLETGFNSTPKTDPKFKNQFCEYYRVTPQQYDILNECKNKIQYAVALRQLGILNQWKFEADNAIKRLEELTETKFIVDSKRTQYNEPTPEQLEEEQERIKSGYYTTEQIEQQHFRIKPNGTTHNLNHYKKITTMKTTINNDLRVYQVTTSTGKQAFCNIEDLNKVVESLDTRQDYFKVYHFWNNKPQYLNRKNLDLMFDGAQLKREFNY